jgi:Putative esterase
LTNLILRGAQTMQTNPRSAARRLLIASAAMLAITSCSPLWGQATAVKPHRSASADSRPEPLAFEVTFAPTVHSEPIKGRVYVFLGPDQLGTKPRFGPDWFTPQPFFAVNVERWKPGESLRLGPVADGFPGPLSELSPGRYTVQAVARVNVDTHKIGDGEGNLYGPVIRVDVDPKRPGTVALKLDRLVEPEPFPSSGRLKLVELSSPKLSAFYHRPIKHRAAVILPRLMAKNGRATKLPAVYLIPGFGGDHLMAERFIGDSTRSFATDFIRVVLDPDCGTGHHVFADSATNGPRGTALIEEFIPYLERAFPILADSGARLLNGHSSGGWSSLWLQVTYPDYFGGTWSTSPDPVDFRDFQRINIYASGENMFRDRDGNRRPIARMGRTPALYYDRFSHMDDVIDWGGQLGSFEAVFSPVGPDGRPRKLWNRKTGAIDLEVARSWEAYDIRLILERNWHVLGPKLNGKLHVIMGDMDNFYLEGATRLLKESLAKLGSDAVVELVAGRDHSTLYDEELAQRFDREMHAAVRDLVGRQPEK